MAYQFYLRHLDRTGTIKRAAITDFLQISYSRVVNRVATLNILFNFEHPVVQNLDEFDLFEVWWGNTRLNVPVHLDFETVFRDIDIQTNLDGVTTVNLSCPAQLSILDYRVIAWPSGIDNRSTFSTVKAETLFKTIVNYNCTSVATVANGRTREGDLASGMGMTLTTAADLARGNDISKAFSNKGLLPTLSSLAQISGGDFTLTRGTGATWEFEFHEPTVGSDKRTGSDRVEFSLSKANMMNPKLTIKKRNEKTIAITGGQGKGSDRLYVIQPATDFAANNDVEMYRDARNQVNATSVADAALAELNARDRAEISFDFDVIQTDAVFYSPIAVTGKKTYQEGDYITAVYGGLDFDREISAINIKVTPTSNTSPVAISVETEAII